MRRPETDASTDIEDKVPESVKTGIRFVYVEDVREVEQFVRDEKLKMLGNSTK